MLANPYAALAAACYLGIAYLLFAQSMKNNPHFWRPDHRIQLVCLVFFSLFWPLTMPVAIFFYSRSPEGKLMAAKRRRPSGQRTERVAEKAEYAQPGAISRKQYVPHTRRNTHMPNTPTSRQRQLVAHVIDIAVTVTSSGFEAVDGITGSTRLVEHFSLDSLDVVEFIVAAEDRWPGLEIYEDDAAEKVLNEGTILDVAVWLEGLLVAQFGDDWQPGPKLVEYPD